MVKLTMMVDFTVVMGFVFRKFFRKALFKSNMMGNPMKVNNIYSIFANRKRSRGRAVRQRSAKPRTAVQIRSRPQQEKALIKFW